MSQPVFTVFPGLPFTQRARYSSGGEYVDMTGYTIESQARILPASGGAYSPDKSPAQATGEPVIAFACAVNADQTGDNKGLFTFGLTAEQTAALATYDGRTFAFDFLFTDSLGHKAPMNTRLFIRVDTLITEV